ncbi:IclR family transcriptional regulator [Telmatospirillum sp. J64-1]|uniref:IclR family transcriptional regulator n=1 Tax=Telmatospirillum sp. J64-1 TaxID=2502183 RepID=UPI00115D6669|nr:IclR family transcriptional regulator [Telmatospirillum sp. J64-1]
MAKGQTKATAQTADVQPVGAALPAGPEEGAKRQPNKGIQSVDRALDILEALASSRNAVALTELAAKTGLNFSTCHHLLATLARRGYATQEPETRRYLLGNRVFELAEGRSRQLHLVTFAMPALEELNRVTSESVHLAVIEAFDLVTLAKLPSLHAVKVDSDVMGKSKAAHATATGKAILAHMSENVLAELLARHGLQRFTDHTICSVEELKRELAKVREQGWSEDWEEFQPGVVCIGAPIYDRTGKVVASVSSSTPTMRATDEALARTRSKVAECAATISRQLGWANAA